MNFSDPAGNRRLVNAEVIIPGAGESNKSEDL